MKILQRIPIVTAVDLAEAILSNECESFIGDRVGNAFSELLLVEETLSDGSKVKDFRLR